MTRTLVLVPTLVALAACTLEVPAPDPGPGGAQQALRACRAAAGEERMEVRRVLATRELRRDGRPYGQEVAMRVARGDRTFPVTCTYSYASGHTRIDRA